MLIVYYIAVFLLTMVLMTIAGIIAFVTGFSASLTSKKYIGKYPSYIVTFFGSFLTHVAVIKFFVSPILVAFITWALPKALETVEA